MKTRYINRKQIEPIMLAVDHQIDFSVSTITTGYLSRPLILLTGGYPIDKFLKSDMIPDDLEVVRVPVTNRFGIGTLCLSKDVAYISIHIPPNTIKLNVLNRAAMASVIRTLGIQELDIEVRNNDLLFNLDNKRRKFLGTFGYEQKNGWLFYVLNVTFQADYSLMNKIYRLDTEKMAKKSNVKDMRDVVIGIDEFRPSIDRNEFLDGVVSSLAQRLDWDIYEGYFTKEELRVIKKMSPILSLPDFVIEAKNYDSLIR